MYERDKEVRTDSRRTSRETAVSKSGAHLMSAIEAFLLSRRVGNCTSRTLAFYRDCLQRFARFSDTTLACGRLFIQRYLSSLQGSMKPVSVHAHFRTLRVFYRWCVETGLLDENPTTGIAIKLPRPLPRVPEDEAIRKLLAACPATYEGRRNKVLIALLADSGLRISEALRLRVEDVSLGDRTLLIKSGKGQKDGTGFFGAETAALLRAFLQRRNVHPEDYLFSDREGHPLAPRSACHILHRLSVKAQLPRKVGPHALRHYAATSILKQTGDLELVRQVLRHETLTMALLYARLTRTDVSRKFRRASPLDHLVAGR